ncbi:MAG: hypothetical protein COV34_02795 [Candidatus Zambryskibacteria bacterium CG10_big_fil_rev_8_21_14_0_10_42_12]|uniref:Uncharacterized protein n=1 Tax=Candidatus Zambryskibacteria bacterium CG10_big_fil_rev_8_21_14_0_10_42_12 TaxID=1975115 RepID=A0A2H0QUN4_9BACT|nr:MAG: hypothetical protein COV34_02795 [Candidatus Zambryskibacteria bacterium CG10_big_fil_rev_8_21_14_0_10_42_12]
MNKNLKKNKQAGFGLIETLIYIALMAFIIGGGVMAAYYLIDASEQGGDTVNTNAEAEFLLRKIDWVLTGADTIFIPTPGNTSLTLYLFNDNITLNNITVGLSDGQAYIERGDGQKDITGDRVLIENLQFEHIPATGGKPAGIKVTFTADGEPYVTTKYLRN